MIDAAVSDQICSYLFARHHAFVRPKSAPEMQAVAAVFGVATMFGATGLPAPDAFISRYATTIGPIIYLPDGYDPWERLLVVAHEVTHVDQFYADPLGFPVKYLQHREARSTYEAAAYRSGLEIHHAVTGQLPARPEDLAVQLTLGYSLGPEDVLLAQDLLEIAATSVSHNVVSTRSALEVIAKLRSLAPQVLSEAYR